MIKLWKIIFSIFSLIWTIVFAVSLYVYIFVLPENKCEMTYMFQWPEYIEISLPKDVKEAFPRYGLYAYGEGMYAEQLRQGEYRGIPVLFIPGNAGSHRQVRSLGSVSMTKTERSSQPGVPEFNYFSIDYDEELSGLYGGYLMRQTEFAAKCIHRILALYKSQSNRPKSLIIVGHSMGGVIARGLFSTQNFSSSLISVLITLASPHFSPVVLLDQHMGSYYAQVNEYWVKNAQDSLRNLTVLSIGSGRRDVMVRSELTVFERRLKSFLYDNSSRLDENDGLMLFETTAPKIPLLWATTDHLAIVWCKQLVMATVRALFDMATRTSTGVVSFSQNVTLHRKVIKHYFFDRNDWRSNKTAKAIYESMLDEESRLKHDLLSRLVSVVPNYAHYMPSLCFGFICIFLIFDYHLEATSYPQLFSKGVVRLAGFLLISVLFALRIKNDNDFGSAMVAVFMSFGLFSATKFVAVGFFSLARCCRCSKSSITPEKIVQLRTINFYYLFVPALLLTLTASQRLAIIPLFLMICYTFIIQVVCPGDDAASEKKAILVVQACLVLVCLCGPWTVVTVQNWIRGGIELPFDPTFLLTLLMVLLNANSQFKWDRSKLAWMPLVAGLVTIGFCDRLYWTMYCCSLLLGLYSKAYRRSLDSAVSSSKVD